MPVDPTRQADIEDRHSGPLPFDRRQARLARAGLDDPEPLPPEVHVDEVGNIAVVLDDDDGALLVWPYSQHA